MTTSSRTQKADILDSMMKHPETRRLIKDALASPLGSTSRTKLQKHMSIMSKLHNTNYGSNDGAGGPGVVPEQYAGQQPEFDPVHNPSEGSKGMVIFHKIPTPKITYGKVAPTMSAARKDQARAGSFDGSGGPGMQYERMGQPEAATYDGAGGFFGDLYNTVSNGVSNFFTPTTPSTPAPTTANSTPAMSSSYTPMFSTPYTLPSSTPSYNSQNIPLMAQGSYNNTPVAPAPTAFTNNLSPSYVAPPTSTSTYATAPFKPSVPVPPTLTSATTTNPVASTSGTPVVTPTPATTYPSLDPNRPITTSWDNQISDYNDRSTAENAARGLGSGVTKFATLLSSVPAGAEAAVEYALGNTGKGLANLFLKKSNQYKYSDMGDTWGAKKIAQFNNMSENVSDALTGAPFDPNAAKTLGKAPVTATKTDPATGKEVAPVTNPVKTDSGTPNGPVISETSGKPGTSGNGSGAKNYSDKLGLPVTTPLSVVAQTKTKEEILAAIKANEGGSPAGVINNSGNIKFNNLPGQIDSGVKAADGGTFASYKTPQEGDDAIYSIFMNAAAGKSSAYGPNPTLGSFADKYTNTGTGTDSNGNNINSTSGSSTSYSGTVDPTTGAYTPNNNQPGAIRVDALGNPIKADVQTYIDSSMGAGAATNAIYGSLGMKGEAADAVAIDKADRLKSGVDEDKANYEKLIKQGTTLPEDMAAFIKSRDVDLTDMDKQIADYNKVLATTNDPNSKEIVRSNLNRLYSMRSTLNTNYMGIIKDAVKDHQSKIDDAKSKFDTDLASYQTETARDQAISKDRYATIKATVTDMYTDMQNAPLRAMQLREYQEKLYTAAHGSAVDASKLTYLYQDNEMKNQFTDSNGRFSPGGKSLTDWKDLMVTGSGMTVPNFIMKWDTAIGKYMAEPETDKGDFSNKQKMDVAKDQIAQYTNLATQGMLDNTGSDPYSKQLVAVGIDGARNMAKTFSEKQVLELKGKGPAITEAVKGLAAKGWMPGSSMRPVTESEFITNFNAKVGGDYSDMAKAIYYRFSQVATNPANTQQALDSMLYNISSTKDAQGVSRISSKNLKTPDEMVKTAADIYAGYLLESAMYKDPGSGLGAAYSSATK